MLRKAFAADAIDRDAATLWVSDDECDATRQHALVKDWQLLVIDPLAEGYRLWGCGT